MYFVYFNGEFYYQSEDRHYKHGMPYGTYYTKEEAIAVSKALNIERDRRK